MLICLCIFLLTAVGSTTVSAQDPRSITDDLLSELSNAVYTVEKVLVSVGFSQCDNVKKILGLDYENYKDKEPDTSKLTLEFISRPINVSFKLSEAASLIPKSGLFDLTQPLYIYLHGYTDDPFKSGFTMINNAFLSQGYRNILALDASSLIHWLYLRSSTMVRFIGNELGKLIAALVQDGMDPSKIHMVGHSLGSQIAGHAGKTLTKLTGSRVGRITGLDPAGPCFANLNSSLRLNKADADFVDVIHTDAGILGIDSIVGHADFFPNKGAQQPGCLTDSCSHSRVVELFTNSVINPDTFMAVRCDNWESFKNGYCNYTDTSVMGFACTNNTSGQYYLRTGAKSPYGLGKAGLKYVS